MLARRAARKWLAELARAATQSDERLLFIEEPIRISYLWRPLLTDPGDDLVLETAVNGRANAVVTFNRQDFEPGAGRFGVEVLAQVDAVARLEKRR